MIRQTQELETLQRRHREELERFQQHQLQLLIQQQQQASALHQHQHHPLLYHTVATNISGQEYVLDIIPSYVPICIYMKY